MHVFVLMFVAVVNKAGMLLLEISLLTIFFAIEQLGRNTKLHRKPADIIDFLAFLFIYFDGGGGYVDRKQIDFFL